MGTVVKPGAEQAALERSSAISRFPRFLRLPYTHSTQYGNRRTYRGRKNRGNRGIAETEPDVRIIFPHFLLKPAKQPNLKNF
jgi:hypothetical protein